MPGGAHPHVFIDAGLDFRFDDAGALDEIGVVWAFDDFSSMLIVEDMEMDSDHDGALTEAEIAGLTEMFTDWPEDFAGDLYLSRDGRAVPLSGPRDLRVDWREGRLIVTHARAPAEPLPAGGAIGAQVYDPTYYTYYELTAPPEVSGRADCRLTVEPADIAAAQERYAEELDKLSNEEILEEGKTPEIGGAFADRVELACAE